MPEPDTTGLIRSGPRGDPVSQDELFQHLYKKLRTIAAGLLRSGQECLFAEPDLADSRRLPAHRLIIDHAKRRKRRCMAANFSAWTSMNR